MNIQNVIGIAALVAGSIYAFVIILKMLKEKEKFNNEPGNVWKFMISEFIVYFLCALGFPDFVMNTVVIKKFNAAEDKYLPDNLVGCCLLCSPLIAFFYLNTDGTVDTVTLVSFMGCLAVGGIIGSNIVKNLNGQTIKSAMSVLILISMIFVVVKLVVSEQSTGTLTGLRGWKLAVLLVSVIILGAINMMGVPIKPTVASILLLMGVAPLTVITMIIALGCITPLSGGIRVVKDNKYNNKFVLGAMTAGSVGAALGSQVTINLSSVTLCIILLAMMAIAFVTLVKTKKT